MPRYIPFLKFKQNEIQAIGELDSSTRSKIRPFFDVPRTSKNQSASEIEQRLDLGIKHLSKLVNEIETFDFYIDNFDLDDDIELQGISQYAAILASLINFNAIPVLALDRHANHNLATFDHLKARGGYVAIRLQVEDVESYSLTKVKLHSIWNKLTEIGTRGVHLIIDFRYIDAEMVNASTLKAINFLKKFLTDFSVEEIIVTGSTIPAIIGELIPTDSSVNVTRREFLMWKQVTTHEDLDTIVFGDYGVVSPDYADIDLDPRLFRRISTPKAFYPYEHMLFAARGISFQSHPAGNGQYFLIADLIEKETFFRGKNHSYGDIYI